MFAGMQEAVCYDSLNRLIIMYWNGTHFPRLDYDFAGRDEIASAIDRSLLRQRQINRMNQVSGYGDNRYCLFVHQPQIQAMSDKNKEDYIFALMLMQYEADRYVLVYTMETSMNLSMLNLGQLL
ncbi:hypothetical protein [Paenibacillus lautus]|uniref:hypothetical protein n=2 Tax=Paenibacillus lautus TaxID=1401 RepID=UPI003D2CF9AE